MSDITRKSWEEFRDSKMLWWVNRIIHTFGWAIVFEYNDGKLEVYPARVAFRGFQEYAEEQGFQGLTAHLKENIDQLVEESKADAPDSK